MGKEGHGVRLCGYGDVEGRWRVFWGVVTLNHQRGTVGMQQRQAASSQNEREDAQSRASTSLLGRVCIVVVLRSK